MVRGLYTAYTGMVNEQKRLDVVANNLANASTTGYKKEGVTSQSFDDELALRIKTTDTNNLVHAIGNMNFGVKIGETYTNYDQGSFKNTENASDLAISGDGFFAIAFTAKDGTQSIKYTRDGSFTVDANGYLVTSDGDHVLNMNGALNSNLSTDSYVKIDPTMDYTIDEQGYIWQDDQQVGQIGIVDIADYNYISKYGENLYELVDGGQVTTSTAGVLQGYLEASNVNVVDEMVSMITIQRAYEAGQKMIQTEDDTLDIAVSQVGRV